ncbi:MAG: DUF2478 domain-containing protein [Planctomycetes bacterium]|nr:DUF2478 domain-containing protein [Planctomycetota bacterium]
MSLALLLGERYEGKTTSCQRLAEQARAHGRTVAGIVAPAVYEDGQRLGYDVLDLSTGATARLATVLGPGCEKIGRFHLLDAGLALGRSTLLRVAQAAPDLVIVDEVGRLELRGGGWAPDLDALVAGPRLTLFAVRRTLAAQVAGRWYVAARDWYDLADGVDAVINTILGRLDA